MSSFGLRLAASSSRAARLASLRTQACRVQSRELHQRKQLSYPIEEGLGTFLPPHTLKMIAEDYQQGLLDRLNEQIRGTALENKSIVQTVVEAARDPNKVLEFNYASEALNNSFFLESVKPPPSSGTSHEHEVHDPLMRRIRHHWSSLAHFQSSFSAAALGMFSSGWVWLVTDKNGQLGIMPTFGTGTLLVRSGKPSETFIEWQKAFGQAVLPLTEDSAPVSPSHTPSGSPPPPSSPTSGLSHQAPPLNPHTPSRSMSLAKPRDMYKLEKETDLNQQPDFARLGDVLYPLLCVSVHEHAWVSAGYGVWGKEEYMKRFWTVVNWKNASDLFSKVVPPS
ncbi:Manganese/iron superoxide dismutase [Trametes elegans]|nr:Manganese/iron superoxide dismutase [Trametes elegans]